MFGFSSLIYLGISGISYYSRGQSEARPFNLFLRPLGLFYHLEMLVWHYVLTQFKDEIFTQRYFSNMALEQKSLVTPVILLMIENINYSFFCSFIHTFYLKYVFYVMSMSEIHRNAENAGVNVRFKCQFFIRFIRTFDICHFFKFCQKCN
jgi:hypothetical protein